MQPTAEQVGAALARVLSSPVFTGAARASALLRYLVERTLAGDGAQLKEYVVGVELFERGDDFDPRIDTIVRVEARRLRARLDEYYDGPGAQDRVRITLPRGGYVPAFSLVDSDTGRAPSIADVTDAAATSGRVASAAPVRQWSRVIWLAAPVLLVIVAAAAWPLVSRGAARQASGVRIAVLPVAHFSTAPDVALIAARLTDGVTAELARVPELSVVSRTSAARFASDAQPVREAARALDVALVMEGSVVVEAGGVHAIIRIVDAEHDRKVWVGEYDSPPEQLLALQKRIASEVAAAVLARYAAR